VALTYGTPTSDYPLVDCTVGTDGCEFTMLIDGEKCHFRLPVAGWGNLIDAAAAISAAHRLGVPVSNICASIASFRGIERIIQHLGGIGGRAVYYDYAHHPREIENTLDLLKRRHGSVGVIFRPHTYSRTAAFLDGFRSSLSIADAISLVDVYAARESESDGVTSSYLADYIGDRAALVDPADALDYILTHSHGAIVLMGAGEVDGILEDIKNRLDT
jgi:UDP-N-acetylmuramate--alanine ligase